MSLLSRLFGSREKPIQAAATDETLVPVFIPALVVLLMALEKQKGAPLTEQEVYMTRDEGACIMMRQSHAKEFQAGRGGDLNPENAWNDWQEFRDAL